MIALAATNAVTSNLALTELLDPMHLLTETWLQNAAFLVIVFVSILLGIGAVAAKRRNRRTEVTPGAESGLITTAELPAVDSAEPVAHTMPLPVVPKYTTAGTNEMSVR